MAGGNEETTTERKESNRAGANILCARCRREKGNVVLIPGSFLRRESGVMWC